MTFLLLSFLISLTQIPGIILVYLPFHYVLNKNKRNLLFTLYIIALVFEFIFTYIFFEQYSVDIGTFKILIMIFSYLFFIINCIVIKNRFFQHMVILGIVSIYVLFLHSLVAFLQNYFFLYKIVYHQLFIQCALYLILFLISLYPIIKLLKSTFMIYIRDDIAYYWNIIWIVPHCLFFSDVIMTMNNHWINTFNQLICRGLTFFACFIVFKVITINFEDIKNEMDIYHNNKLLQLQVNSLNDRLSDINKNNENLRILRHDMRHYMNLITSLAKNKDYEEIKKIIENMDNTLKKTKINNYCENLILNSSLSIFIEEAKNNHIKVESNIHIPSNLNIDNIDLAVVILNLMENAFKASLKQKLLEDRIIHINCKYKDGIFAFRLKNKFNGDVVFDKDGYPITFEKNHGIGMGSIKAFIKKYNANISFNFENNYFSVILFINTINT